MSLTVKDLRSGYGSVPVLHGITFEHRDAEILGIIGHNGMGKTTLLRTLAGVLATGSGSIIFGGRHIERLEAYRRGRIGLGYVPQGDRGFPGLTVLESLRLATSVTSIGGVRPMDELLTIFPELKRFLHRQCTALSGGERQMLAIARAVSRSPKLLLLDELSEGVQPSVIESFAERLLDLNKSDGVGMLVVDQELAFVGSMARRALVVQKGRILREVDTRALRDADVLNGFAAT